MQKPHIVEFLISTMLKAQIFLWTFGVLWSLWFFISKSYYIYSSLGIFQGLVFFTFLILAFVSYSNIELNHKIVKIVLVLINLAVLTATSLFINANPNIFPPDDCPTNFYFRYLVYAFIICEILFCISLALASKQEIISSMMPDTKIKMIKTKKEEGKND